MLFPSRICGVILIIVGVLLLASTLGYIPRLGPLIHQWWPLILVIIGVAMLVRR